MHLVRVLVGDDRDDLLHAQFRLVDPRVVLAPPPHDHRELATRCERLANVAKRGAGHREEHRSEPGEREVVRTTEIVHLHVGDEERCVVDGGFPGFALGGRDEAAGAVTPIARPAGPTLQAMRRVLSPKPQPTSSTFAPSQWRCRASASLLCGARPSISRCLKRQNLSKRTVFHASTTMSLFRPLPPPFRVPPARSGPL